MTEPNTPDEDAAPVPAFPDPDVETTAAVADPPPDVEPGDPAAIVGNPPAESGVADPPPAVIPGEETEVEPPPEDAPEE